MLHCPFPYSAGFIQPEQRGGLLDYVYMLMALTYQYDFKVLVLWDREIMKSKQTGEVDFRQPIPPRLDIRNMQALQMHQQTCCFCERKGHNVWDCDVKESTDKDLPMAARNQDDFCKLFNNNACRRSDCNKLHNCWLCNMPHHGLWNCKKLNRQQQQKQPYRGNNQKQDQGRNNSNAKRGNNRMGQQKPAAP